jgi:intracellular sulfur oxidation DsrE/DsrF family protein
MDRRTAVKSVLAAGTGMLAAGAATPAMAEAQSVPRVVYHLSEQEKVNFVLGNLRNHIDGMGGPDKVEIAVVVHGPPLRAFRADTGNDDVKAKVASLVKEGVVFHACHNTMEGMKLTLAGLLPGFAVAEKGGVVKLAELQGQGWIYLRP